jgi:hypothetical protein
VEKDLFPEYTPEKHNLQYYPTVNDLQNHIHQAIKDIEAGVLPITAQTVSPGVNHGAMLGHSAGGLITRGLGGVSLLDWKEMQCGKRSSLALVTLGPV